MPTLTIEISEEQRDKLERLVAEGRYANVSEAVEDAVDVFVDGDEIDDAFLREVVRESLADPRPSIPIDEAFEILRRAREGGAAPT